MQHCLAPTHILWMIQGRRVEIKRDDRPAELSALLTSVGCLVMSLSKQTRLHEHMFPTLFSFFYTDSLVYRKRTVNRTMWIQRAPALYYKLIKQCNVLPTIYVEICLLVGSLVGW
jgi:hypothetical protein